MSIVENKAYSKRLENAILQHSQAPDGHGRQKWLRDQIETRFNTKLSPEAIRKWFAAESKPRANVNRMIAQILEVDEAWLSLGITPDASLSEKRQQSFIASGAVNLVAGMIQMNNGHIAFPDEEGAVDLYAIVRGKQHSVVVRTGAIKDGSIHITVPPQHEKSVVLCVVQREPTSYAIVRIPADVIHKSGTKKGGYLELEIVVSRDRYAVAGEVLPIIQNFSDLEGVKPGR